MSRSWLIGQPKQWRMFCDVCFKHDHRTFPTQPDLGIFHAEGWFIGTRWDACPSCIAKGKQPTDSRHRDYPQAVAA